MSEDLEEKVTRLEAKLDAMVERFDALVFAMNNRPMTRPERVPAQFDQPGYADRLHDRVATMRPALRRSGPLSLSDPKTFGEGGEEGKGGRLA
jgi:hypothetical protein